jgi:hypothetical protein
VKDGYKIQWRARQEFLSDDDPPPNVIFITGLLQAPPAQDQSIVWVQYENAEENAFGLCKGTRNKGQIAARSKVTVQAGEVIFFAKCLIDNRIVSAVFNVPVETTDTVRTGDLDSASYIKDRGPHQLTRDLHDLLILLSDDSTSIRVESLKNRKRRKANDDALQGLGTDPAAEIIRIATRARCKFLLENPTLLIWQKMAPFKLMILLLACVCADRRDGAEDLECDRQLLAYPQSGPDTCDTLLFVASLYTRQGKFRGAVTFFERILAKSTNLLVLYSGHYALADLYCHIDDTSSAQRHWACMTRTSAWPE